MTPKNYPQNLHTPQFFFLSENQKNIEIQNFEPKKMTRAYVCMKITEYPPGASCPRLKRVGKYDMLAMPNHQTHTVTGSAITLSFFA